jgi:hypothetical protein
MSSGTAHGVRVVDKVLPSDLRGPMGVASLPELSWYRLGYLYSESKHGH